MKEPVSLDANVLVYLFDADEPDKQTRVQKLLWAVMIAGLDLQQFPPDGDRQLGFHGLLE